MDNHTNCYKIENTKDGYFILFYKNQQFHLHVSSMDDATREADTLIKNWRIS